MTYQHWAVKKADRGVGVLREVRERSEQVLDEVDLSDFKSRSWQAL